MNDRLTFPVTRMVILTAAVVFNHWLTNALQRRIILPEVIEEDYPVGCYL